MMSWRFVTFAALFVTCLLTANIMAAKLISVGGVVLTAGIVVFPVSYIVGDVLTEVWGYATARRVIWARFPRAAPVRGALAPGGGGARGVAGLRVRRADGRGQLAGWRDPERAVLEGRCGVRRDPGPDAA